MGLLGCMVNVCLIFKETVKLFSGEAVHFTFSGNLQLNSNQHFGIVPTFYFSCCNLHVVMSLHDLICILLMAVHGIFSCVYLPSIILSGEVSSIF